MSDFVGPATRRCGMSQEGHYNRTRPGCGASIRWVSLNGRPHPINPEPSPKGTLGIIEHEVADPGFYEPAIAVNLSKVRRATWQGDLYVSHFATCPQAEAFRARGVKTSEPSPEPHNP